VPGSFDRITSQPCSSESGENSDYPGFAQMTNSRHLRIARLLSVLGTAGPSKLYGRVSGEFGRFLNEKAGSGRLLIALGSLWSSVPGFSDAIRIAEHSRPRFRGYSA
jgi:hypothetical protein